MPIEGPLSEMSVQDVLQLLELARKTGVLTVRSERLRDEATVHFERGLVVFAMRRRSTRRLGQQLLRAGKLTERELERALEIQRQDPRQRLAEILLEMGSVSEEELKRHLRFQIEETIYDLLAWDEGRFRFEERPALDPERLAVHVRVESLLMEGARRIDEWSRLESRVPSVDAVPVLAPASEGDPPVLDLRPDEWEVIAEIDGARDLRQIAANLGRSTFDVAKIIYGLVSVGVVQLQDHPVRLPEGALAEAARDVEAMLAAGDAEGAARRANELLAAYPDCAEFALLAGRALGLQGRMRAAAEALARAVTLDPLAAEAHYQLGFAAARIGEFARAAEAWDAFLRLAPLDARAEAVAEALAAVRALHRFLTPDPEGIPTEVPAHAGVR